MKEISKEETMSIGEVAKALNVSVRTVQRHAENMGLTRNGYATYLNQEQVTIIKLKIERSGRNDLDNVVELPKTKLERSLLVKQAMILQEEIIKEQQSEIEQLKPKALEYDLFISGKDFHEVGTVAKSFDIGRNKFFEMLRKEKILMGNNLPYSDYKKYFKVVYKPVSINGVIDNKPVTLFNPQGISYIAKRFNLIEVK